MCDSQRAVTARVRQFYEQFNFPGARPLDQDGLILMRSLAGCLPGSKGKGRRRRVLDAGCGTGNTLLSLARQFEGVDFLGIDLSASSLAVARRAAEEAELPNVRFRRWDLLEPGLGEGLFDVVLCLGVLHHTANMPLVLANLREAMSDEGRLYLWVYGQHGRYRHSLNRRLLQLLASAEPPAVDAVQLARELLRSGGQGAVGRDLFGDGAAASWEKILLEPVWIADQFLCPNEVSLTMECLLSLIHGGGFELARWLGLPEQAPRLLGSDLLQERFARLDRRRQLIALDLLLKPNRYFLLLRQRAGPAEASA